MSEYSTVQERDAFDERIFEMVQEYLEDEANVLKDGRIQNGMGLSINLQTLELAINSQENNLTSWDFFPIEKLIRQNEGNIGNEPDCDATHKLASSYCFVR